MNIEFHRMLDLLLGKLTGWVRDAVVLLPNLVVAVVILAVSVLVARALSLIVARIMHAASESVAVTRLVTTLTRLVVIIGGTFTALGVLNLDKTVASLLAGAGVIGLAIGFAFQEIAANFFAGVLIAFRKPFREGDIVRIESFEGKVSEITLRTTSITTYSGLEVLVPNKDMFTKPVINFTSTPDRRVEISLGLAYDADLEHATAVIVEALKTVPERLPNRPVEFCLTEFGESAMVGQARFWMTYPGARSYNQVVHDAIIAIKRALDGEQIGIPFPIRTLDASPGFWAGSADLVRALGSQGRDA